MTKLWLDDIVTVLSGDGTLIPHASFAEYASAYHTHRSGTEATNGVDYWTNKLQGIGSVSDSTLWPPQRTPEFFKGNDFEQTDLAAVTRRALARSDRPGRCRWQGLPTNALRGPG